MRAAWMRLGNEAPGKGRGRKTKLTAKKKKGQKTKGSSGKRERTLIEGQIPRTTMTPRNCSNRDVVDSTNEFQASNLGELTRTTYNKHPQYLASLFNQLRRRD